MAYPYPWRNVQDALIIPSGALRNAIQIQSQTTTQDSFGGQVNGWVTVLSCFAAIETESMREVFQDGFVSRVIHRITIRWPGPSIPILSNMRVVIDPVPGGQSSVFQIQAIENVQQRNRIVVMTCLQINDATVAGT